MLERAQDMAVSTELIELIRNALRISTTSEAITAEIKNSIAAALLDLAAQGVKNLDQTDGLIIRAVTLFCRADFNFNGKAEQYRQSYDLQKMSLALDVDYNTEKSEG